jgi:uncharacterized protein (TIGR02588 family)
MKIRKNVLEWSVFAASVALIAAVVGVLVYGARSTRHRPPLLLVSAGTAERLDSGHYRLPVTVKNEGDQTAEQAKIEVILEENGEEVERGEMTIPFVPQGSTRQGWIVFSRDPRCCRVSARATGYHRP